MTVKWNKDAVAQVRRDPGVGRALLDAGWQVAEVAAGLAPKSPGGGEGAKSIRAEMAKTADADFEVRVSWDRDHFYMGFAEFGTEHQKATPFLRPAAGRFQ